MPWALQGWEELPEAHAEPLSNVLMVQLVRSSKQKTREGLSVQKPKKSLGECRRKCSVEETSRWKRASSEMNVSRGLYSEQKGVIHTCTWRPEQEACSAHPMWPIDDTREAKWSEYGCKGCKESGVYVGWAELGAHLPEGTFIPETQSSVLSRARSKHTQHPDMCPRAANCMRTMKKASRKLSWRIPGGQRHSYSHNQPEIWGSHLSMGENRCLRTEHVRIIQRSFWDHSIKHRQWNNKKNKHIAGSKGKSRYYWKAI